MQRVSELMRARPYAFNMLSSAAIAFVGDLAAQRIENAPPRRQLVAAATDTASVATTAAGMSDVKFKLDALRSGTICAWSAGVMAPFYTRYYVVMDRVFPLKTAAHIGSKVLITAATCAPVMNGLYLGVTTAIEDRFGERPRPAAELTSAIEAKVRTELPGLVLTSAQLWMPVNTLNWMFFPTHARVLLSTVVSVGWNAYISLVQHRPLPSAIEK